MIQMATIEDIDMIELMGPRFFEYGQFDKKGLRYNKESCKGLLSFLIQNKGGILLVANEDGNLCGSIGGIIAPWMMDNSQLILMETWWWVNPEYRNKRIGLELIRAFQDEGKKRGANLFIMVTLQGPKEKSLIKFYTSLGMKHLENHYIKEI